MSGTVYLHIGLEKTGSTTLQRALGQAHDALEAEQLRFLSLRGDVNSHALAAACVDWRKQEDLHQWHRVNSDESQLALQDELVEVIGQGLDSGRYDVLMSSEHLSSRILSSAEFTRLTGLLARVSSNVVIVVFLRRQENFISATYPTQVKAGFGHRFDLRYHLVNQERYNFALLLSRWAFHFPNCLRVRVYREEWKVEPGGLESAFMSAVGLPETFLDVQAGSNQSPPTVYIEALRILNLMASVSSDPDVRRLRDRFAETLDPAPTGRSFSIGAKEVGEVREEFASSNRSIRSFLGLEDYLYLVGRPGTFPPKACAQDESSSEETTQAALRLVLELLQGVLNKPI